MISPLLFFNFQQIYPACIASYFFSRVLSLIVITRPDAGLDIQQSAEGQGIQGNS